MKFRNILASSALIAALAGTPLTSGCKDRETIEQRLSVPYNASELSLEEFTNQMLKSFPATEEYSKSEWKILYDSYSNANEIPETALLKDSHVRKYSSQFPWMNNTSVESLRVGDKNLLSRIVVLEGIPIN